MGSFKRWCYDHGIRWRAQNLDRDGKGSIWREGRAWLNIFAGNGETGVGYRELVEINPSWHLGRWGHPGIGLEIGGGDSDSEIGLHLGVPFATAWLTFDGPALRRFCDAVLPGYWIERSGKTIGGYDYQVGGYQHFDQGGPNRVKVTQAREVRIGFHDGSAWWSLWHPTMDWDSRTPRWRHGSFNLKDFLLGHPAYTREQVGEPVRALASFPEASYPLLLQREVCTWKRPRWPFATVRKFVDIKAGQEAGGAAPSFQGKGENSYDCDDDAILGTSSEGHSFEAAVGAYVARVLESRARYGHVARSHQAVFAARGE